MEDEPAGESIPQEAEFTAWLEGLGFVVEPAELGAMRRAFDQLATMNRMNRAQCWRSTPGRLGTDE
jgi:hypothetical protein